MLHQSGGEDVLYDAQGMEAWTANPVQSSAFTKPAWARQTPLDTKEEGDHESQCSHI